MAAPVSSSPALRDGNVTVRLLTTRDARPLYQLLVENRDWLAQWEATYPSQTASVVPTLSDVRFSVRGLRAASRDGSAVPWVIECDGHVVGQLNLSSIARGSMSSAVIGYWVSQSVAGQGVMTRAVALVTDFCFRHFGLHRVEICIRPENVASRRIVEKLGFRFEGFRRRFIHINGEWADHFCFALVREEVPGGVFERYRAGLVPADAARIPDDVLAQSTRPLL